MIQCRLQTDLKHGAPSGQAKQVEIAKSSKIVKILFIIDFCLWSGIRSAVCRVNCGSNLSRFGSREYD